MIDPAQETSLTASFRRFSRILSILREVDGEMPLQAMLVFNWVVLNEGGLQREMCDALKMATSTASRNIAALSTIHRLGKAGAGLVRLTESPTDRRAKELHLTEKGRFLAERIGQLL